jgi:hypothetical protein
VGLHWQLIVRDSRTRRCPWGPPTVHLESPIHRICAETPSVPCIAVDSLTRIPKVALSLPLSLLGWFSRLHGSVFGALSSRQPALPWGSPQPCAICSQWSVSLRWDEASFRGWTASVSSLLHQLPIWPQVLSPWLSWTTIWCSGGWYLCVIHTVSSSSLFYANGLVLDGVGARLLCLISYVGAHLHASL